MESISSKLSEISNMDYIERANAYLVKFKELDLSNKLKKIRFENIGTILTNKYVLYITSQLIISLKKLINYEGYIINSRELLSSFTITYFHSEVLSTELSEKEQLIYDKSKELVEYLDNLKNNLDKLELCKIIKKINTYKYVFKNWKKTDKESQITIYCDMYHDYNSKISKLEEENDENKLEYIKHLKNLRDTIKNTIRTFVGDDEIDNTIGSHTYIGKAYDESINDD